MSSTHAVNLYTVMVGYIFSHCSTALSYSGPPQYACCTITVRHTTLFATPLDEWSVRHIDLYVTTHNTHNRQTSMPPWD